MGDARREVNMVLGGWLSKKKNFSGHWVMWTVDSSGFTCFRGMCLLLLLKESRCNDLESGCSRGYKHQSIDD